MDIQSEDAVSKALNMLKRIRRLQGTALIRNGVLTHNDIPTSPTGDHSLFSQGCTKLFSSFKVDEENAEKVLLSFDGGSVLLFHRSPIVLALFFSEPSTLDSVERAGEQFLLQFQNPLGIQTADQSPAAKAISIISAPNSLEVTQQKSGKIVDTKGEWLAFSARIERILTKVLGSSQAKKVIQREITAMGITGDGHLLRNQFRPFGLRLTQRIRDKAIRKQLELELFDDFSDDH